MSKRCGITYETNEEIDMSANGFNVYLGSRNGRVVYVGTTIQKPSDRWRWHKNNGKNLDFEIVKRCDSSDEMLELELELIKKYKPELNKITHRKQNLNKRLSQSDLDKRKGDSEWCQKCLRRRARFGSVCHPKCSGKR